MPRDVATRWNSTYEMLVFALEYRKAVDAMTGDRQLGLRNYEMSEEEWRNAEELRDILKVSHSSIASAASITSVHSAHTSIPRYTGLLRFVLNV